MRVVGGVCKGRRLVSFKGRSIRPTTDRIREAIFNALPIEFPFKRALDLYAGTGAMGIEALSRGCEEAVFVDKSPMAITVIKKNLTICGLEDRARVVKRDVLSSLKMLAKEERRFDLIFIDPPYREDLLEDTLSEIDYLRLYTKGAFVVCESSRKSPLDDLDLQGLDISRKKIYGDTAIYFFRPKEEIEDA